MRDQRFRTGQTLGDGLAHIVVRDFLVGILGIEQPRIGQRRDAGDTRATGSSGCASSSRLGRAGLGVLDVGFDDTATRASAGNSRDINALLGGDALGQR